MREILFRGKLKDNGEWVYGCYVEAEKLDKSGTEYFIIEKSADGASIVVIPETVGQYTGLTDKNGKKIFEGDIIRGAWDSVLEIIFDNDMAQFRTQNEQGFQREIDYYGLDKIEVIGNIYDNPELLEVK